MCLSGVSGLPKNDRRYHAFSIQPTIDDSRTLSLMIFLMRDWINTVNPKFEFPISLTVCFLRVPLSLTIWFESRREQMLSFLKATGSPLFFVSCTTALHPHHLLWVPFSLAVSHFPRGLRIEREGDETHDFEREDPNESRGSSTFH